MPRVETEHPFRQVEALGHNMSGGITPKFVFDLAGAAFVRSPAPEPFASCRGLRDVSLLSCSEGLLDRIMREHFARTVR